MFIRNSKSRLKPFNAAIVTKSECKGRYVKLQCQERSHNSGSIRTGPGTVGCHPPKRGDEAFTAPAYGKRQAGGNDKTSPANSKVRG